MKCVAWRAAAVFMAAASVSFAGDVGGFDETRLLSPSFSLLDGDAMDEVRAVITDAGLGIKVTDTITAEWLDTVDVFCTSQIAFALPDPAEVQAMYEWVQRGGVLIVTASCT